MLVIAKRVKRHAVRKERSGGPMTPAAVILSFKSADMAKAFAFASSAASNNKKISLGSSTLCQR